MPGDGKRQLRCDKELKSNLEDAAESTIDDAQKLALIKDEKRGQALHELLVIAQVKKG